MKLLLDTHAFLWWCADDARISRAAAEAIADGANRVYVSAASGWEIAIKARLGKLELPQEPTTFMRAMLARHAFDVLPITLRHALMDHALPAHHNDPFDRLVVAQAMAEDLVLVSDDHQIRRYDARLLW